MSTSPRWLARFVLIVAGLFTCAIAVALLWTTFMVYDDEGYILYSLREYAQSGGLYDHVYTQYGPFFYVFYRCLSAFGLPFTNESGRVLTLICWFGSAVACAGLVWRQTRGALVATAVTLVAVVLHLWPMVKEPSHPGGLITLLTAVAAWCTTHPKWSGIARGVMLGAIGAMLALTKINIGVFYLSSLGLWWAIHTPSILPQQSRMRWLLAATAAALPLLPMGAHLDTTWVRTLALLSAGAAATIVMASGCPRSMPDFHRLGIAAVIASIITTGLVLAATLLSGTTFRALLDGVILGPLRHPSVYSLSFGFPIAALVIGVASVGLAFWCARQTGRSRFGFIVAARILAVSGYALVTIYPTGFTGGGYVLTFGLITAWVFTFPVCESDQTEPAVRWLALLFVFQSLHAFPVAGSHVAWGTFLWVPLAVLGIYELRAIAPSAMLRRIVVATAVLITALSAGKFAKVSVERISNSDELRLPGAERLRLPESFSSALRLLVRNADRHSDVLFTLPGMMSFNLWTGLPTPTEANATHWFNLLSEGQQQAILQRLQNTPRSAVIVQRGILNYLDSEHRVTATPLVKWLHVNYAPAFQVESYEFWAPKDRSFAPINSARLYSSRDGGVSHMIELVIEAGTSTQIGSIELRKFAGDGSVAQATLTGANSRFIVCAISASGLATAETKELKPPMTLSGLVRIQAFTTAVPADFPATDSIAYLRGPTGARLGEARFIR